MLVILFSDLWLPTNKLKLCRDFIKDFGRYWKIVESQVGAVETENRQCLVNAFVLWKSPKSKEEITPRNTIQKEFVMYDLV